MMLEPTPPPLYPAPPQFRQRLMIVALALVAAQVMYLALGLVMWQSHFQAMASGPEPGSLTTGAFLVGIVAAVVSFPIVKAMAGRQPADVDFSILAPAIQKQFFVGFALSEIASLAGLLVFFLYADLMTLFGLVAVASVSIVTHFRRVKIILEDIEQTRR